MSLPLSQEAHGQEVSGLRSLWRFSSFSRGRKYYKPIRNSEIEKGGEI